METPTRERLSEIRALLGRRPRRVISPLVALELLTALDAVVRQEAELWRLVGAAHAAGPMVAWQPVPVAADDDDATPPIDDADPERLIDEVT
jgi:hypothetical protein